MTPTQAKEAILHALALLMKNPREDEMQIRIGLREAAKFVMEGKR